MAVHNKTMTAGSSYTFKKDERDGKKGCEYTETKKGKQLKHYSTNNWSTYQCTTT
jgi:hypothetical protein